jgi:hypothetical protein
LACDGVLRVAVPTHPYDVALSSLRPVWNANRRGLPDYDRLNEARLPWFHQLDVRVDKQFNFKKWTLGVFIDIQNIYQSPIPLLPYLTVDRNENFQAVVDPSDPSRYQMDLISSDTGRILPSLGVLVDF